MTLRPIAPLSAGQLAARGKLPALVPSLDPGPLPVIRWVSPESLFVSDAYQRDLSERSIKLIRKIVAEFSWSAFKPPIVVEIDAEPTYEVIDGQHTVIAAATHPTITSIPVLVVTAPELVHRAESFIRHNTDRLSATATQLFHSAVAAGDPEAVAVSNVARAVGLRILRNPQAPFPVNSTIAVMALRSLLRSHGSVNTERVLKTITDASSLAPVTASSLRAVAALMFDPEYALPPTVDPRVTALLRREPVYARESLVLAATHGIEQWKALTIVYYRALRARSARVVR